MLCRKALSNPGETEPACATAVAQSGIISMIRFSRPDPGTTWLDAARGGGKKEDMGGGRHDSSGNLSSRECRGLRPCSVLVQSLYRETIGRETSVGKVLDNRHRSDAIEKRVQSPLSPAEADSPVAGDMEGPKGNPGGLKIRLQDRFPLAQKDLQYPFAKSFVRRLS